MNTVTRSGAAEHVRSVPMDLIWTVLTCGLYNIYIQHRQMVALNAMLNQRKYEFLPWAIFTLITCGLYHIYHEYRMSSDIDRLMNQTQSNHTIICVILLVFGLTPVVDAIQQHQINQFYGSTSL